MVSQLESFVSHPVEVRSVLPRLGSVVLFFSKMLKESAEITESQVVGQNENDVWFDGCGLRLSIYREDSAQKKRECKPACREMNAVHLSCYTQETLRVEAAVTAGYELSLWTVI